MSKKKGKFDLTQLVKNGLINDGETFYFVSDPAQKFTIIRHISGEYKINTNEGMTTVHAFAQKCLGTEPPDHASRWFRNEKGTTLYMLWKAEEDAEYAA